MQLHSWKLKISYLLPCTRYASTLGSMTISLPHSHPLKSLWERLVTKITRTTAATKCLNVLKWDKPCGTNKNKDKKNPNEMAFTQNKRNRFSSQFSVPAAPPADAAATTAAAAAVAQTGAVSSASSSLVFYKCICVCMCVRKLSLWMHWNGLTLCGMFYRWENIRTYMCFTVEMKCVKRNTTWICPIFYIAHTNHFIMYDNHGYWYRKLFPARTSYFLLIWIFLKLKFLQLSILYSRSYKS